MRSDEFFSDSDEPVSVKILVTYANIVKVPDRKLNDRLVKLMKNARFAWGVTEKEN